MRVYVYCRVSTDEQSTDDHYSLGNQEQRARDYAKAKGWQVSWVRKDVASGKNTNRPGFQALDAAVKIGEVDVVVVYRLDRLSRNVRDIYDFLDELQRRDIAFASITEGFDTTTAMGRAMLGVAAVFAQLTREMIAENVKDGLLRRAESGKWNGPKWNPPYGYTYVLGGTIEPIPEQAELVRSIFRWFSEDKWGTSKIARYLNNQGVKRESAKPNSGQWIQNKIWEMLQNPVYVGKVVAGDRLVDGIHEPLIDQDTWDATAAVSTARKLQSPRLKASPHLLSGLVRCGTCDRLLAAQKCNYSNRQGDVSFVGFRHSRNEFSGPRHCPGVYHRGDTLELAVISDLLALAKGENVREMALKAAKERLATESGPLRDEAQRLSSQLSEFDHRFESWARLLDDGAIDESQFRLRNAALLKDKVKASKRFEEIEAALGAEERLEIDLAEVDAVWRDLPVAWEHLEFEQKREILRLLIEKVLVYPDRVELQPYHLPPRRLETRRSRREFIRKVT
ncbi:MAG TPA: recombinase family protein [Armatimonadota bacterium]|jgi:site-specific DNA recombinase